MFATSFDSEERSFHNRKTSIAAIVTIVLHALILLILLWVILTPPNPPYTESAGGVSVNFGTDESGTGDIQPMTLTPIQANFTPAASSSANEKSSSPDIATQDLEEAPVISKSNSEVAKPKANERAVLKPTNNSKPEIAKHKSDIPAPVEPKPDPNALFKKGAGGNANNSKSDGTGGGRGDQGSPDGDPNSKSYLKSEGGDGSGPGRGDLRGGFSLKGRKSTSLPPPKFCNEKGNVIIDIKVDRAGNVVDAKYHREGSTITDNCSIENAKRAARLSKFNSDQMADEFQYGSINYVFTVQ